MLGFNHYEAERVMQERVEDAMREAEQAGLIRVANSERLGLLDRVLARVGGFLISAGENLQRRHAPVQTRLTGSPAPCKPMTKPC